MTKSECQCVSVDSSVCVGGGPCVRSHGYQRVGEESCLTLGVCVWVGTFF